MQTSLDILKGTWNARLRYITCCSNSEKVPFPSLDLHGEPLPHNLSCKAGSLLHALSPSSAKQLLHGLVLSPEILQSELQKYDVTQDKTLLMLSDLYHRNRHSHRSQKMRSWGLSLVWLVIQQGPGTGCISLCPCQNSSSTSSCFFFSIPLKETFLLLCKVLEAHTCNGLHKSL